MATISFRFSIVPILLLLASPALAQTYNIGRAPTAAELAASNITIFEDGRGLPVGKGSAVEGEKLFVDQGCSGCHGDGGKGGATSAPTLVAAKGPSEGDAWARGAFAVKAPSPTILFDFIRRAMPLGNEGSLTPDQLYSLVAYLLFQNQIVPKDQVFNQDNLAKIKMPIGTDWVPEAPSWTPGAPRMQGYPG